MGEAKMVSGDSGANQTLDADAINLLLDSEEGAALDFKRDQYPFERGNEKSNNELLKDILAFANSDRYRTAYILIGVEEVKGGRSKLVGVDRHLDDANLHQFVNSKTSRPVEFSYAQLTIADKDIGVISIPIQARPVFLERKVGGLKANMVYVRDGSSTRVAKPNEIVEMGRTNRPRLVEWQIRRLRNLAMDAILKTAQQWSQRHRESAPTMSPADSRDFSKARAWLIEMESYHKIDKAAYPDGMDSFGSLHWVFRTYEGLATECTRTIRTIGPALIESGALILALVYVEESIAREKQIWDGFRSTVRYETEPLPGEANFNIVSLAMITMRFLEVLNDEEHYSDLDHASSRLYGGVAFWQGEGWGKWRR